MKHRAKIWGVALVLVGAAFGSQALTLGRVRGAALIGSPLDIVFPVQMDAAERASSLCFEADVFHADARQDARRVQVLTESTPQADVLNVRVLSATVVDEPVVTVYLRTGCGQKTTRRYVLLADFPGTPPAPPVLPGTTAAPSEAVGWSGAAAASPAPAAVKPKPVRAPKKSAVQAPDPRAPAVDRNPPARPTGQPTLKLDPLDLLSDRVGDMDTFMTFEPPPDALASLKKIESLEASVQALLVLSAKNEASLSDLRMRLQTAESERSPAALVYGLMFLVLACLAALGWLWHRQNRPVAARAVWWGDHRTASTQQDLDTQPAKLPESPEPTSPPSVPPKDALPTESRLGPLSLFASGPKSTTGLDVNLTEMTDSAFYEFMPRGARSAASRMQGLAPLPPGMVRQFNADGVLDIRQQAEFFVSLGQTDRAVQILKRQINESSEPNPFVYLDLLSLFHSLSLKVDFQRLREDFELLFCAHVPAFAGFKNEGQGLESYPDVLSQLCVLWPSLQAVTWIEARIFRHAAATSSRVFDLAAFRDFLLLHAIAGSISAPQAEDAEARDAGQPVAVLPPDVPAVAAAPRLDTPAPSVHTLDLDLNLNLDLDLSLPASATQEAGPVSARFFDLPALGPSGPEASLSSRNQL